MAMEQLTFKTDLKLPEATDEEAEKGVFDALVSVFGVTDSQSDVVDKGAFTGSLDDLRSSGRNMPILWSHQWNDMKSVLGSAQAEQTDKGLVIHAQLDMSNPQSVRALHLMKSGLISEFSIGGFVPKGTAVTKSEGGRLVRHLKAFDLVEVSLVLKGANPATQLLDVKSADGDDPELKSGRVLANKHVRKLKDIHKQLGAVISEVDSTPNGSPETPPPDGGGETKNDEGETVKTASLSAFGNDFALLELEAELARPEGGRA